LPRLPRGSAIVNVASILGAEWPLRLDLHKALAAVKGFEAGAQGGKDSGGEAQSKVRCKAQNQAV